MSDDLRAAAGRVMANFDIEVLRQLIVDLVNIPSPTGEEREAAEYSARWLSSQGLNGTVQLIDESQANCLSRLKGSSPEGAHLLMYAPLDTHLAGLESEDVPGVGDSLPDLYRSAATSFRNEVAGLGAENPKSFAACVMLAAALIHNHGPELRGDLMVGLGAGGMPTNRRPANDRAGVGHGAGVAHMLEQGFRPDYAIIAKPVWQVSYEEAGLTWFRIRTKGLYGYAGLKHKVPYRNPMHYAARLVDHLESWFPEYSRTRARGAVNPQGAVTSIQGGWPFRPAFIPAACDVYVDIRVHPDDDPVDVQRILMNELDRFQKENPDIELETEMLLAIPGSRTSPDNWIVRTCIEEWEDIEGRPHEPLVDYSGSTDANVLRLWGIPTARIGVPNRTGENSWAGLDSMPMNLIDLDQCRLLVDLLVRAAIKTCAREINETRR